MNDLIHDMKNLEKSVDIEKNSAENMDKNSQLLSTNLESKMKRVARYTRVSTKIQESEQQIMAIDNCLKLHSDWNLVVSYDEEPRSSVKVRKKYNDLKRAIELETIDIVVAYKLDRLARKTLELLKLSELCQKHHVSLVLSDGSLDTTTSGGKLQFQLLSAFAEFERNILIERVNLRLDYIRIHGTKSGKPVGHPRKNIDDKQIVNLKNQGYGCQKIGEFVGLSKRAIQNRLEKLGLKSKHQKQEKKEVE